MNNSYFFYGVHLTSEWHLPYPALVTRKRALARIHITVGNPAEFASALQNAAEPEDKAVWCQQVQLRNGANCLRWPGLFEFIVSSDGHQILARTLGATSPESFHTYLLGQVLSHALVKLGFEPLHATAVVLDGSAIAFLGDCGRGKSSLAASFLGEGVPLLTDDLLTLEATTDGVIGHPGPPRIKLLPEMATALLRRHAVGLPMNPLTNKIVVPLKAHESSSVAVPLSTIYVLGSARSGARKVTIRRLTTRQAFVELLRSTFNRKIDDPARLARQFRHAEWLSQNVPVKVVRYPRDVARLGEVREAITADAAAESASRALVTSPIHVQERLAG